MTLHHYPELFLFGLYPEKYNYLEMWRNINELQFFKWQKANSIVWIKLKKWYRQEKKNELDRTEFILKAFENIWRPCLNFVKTLFFRKSEERRLVCQSFKMACASFSVWICTLSLLPLLLFLCVRVSFTMFRLHCLNLGFKFTCPHKSRHDYLSKQSAQRPRLMKCGQCVDCAIN